MAHLDFHVEDVEEGVMYALSCGATVSEIQMREELESDVGPCGTSFLHTAKTGMDVIISNGE